MRLNPSQKLCPNCNNENEENASICRHCGAWLEDNPTKLVASLDKAEASSLQMESFIDAESIPEDGIGIHVAGETRPLYVPISWQLIIGRTREDISASQAFLDLTDMNAAAMGVSRRHAMIRRNTSGYEITDLSSTNGTWLNDEKLVPNKPYPFASGSQLRIGNMRLLVIYHTAKKS
jgi:hypothetical protein